MDVTHVGFRPAGDVRPADQTDRAVRFIAVPRPRAYRLVDLAKGALGSVPFSVLNYHTAEMSAALEKLLRDERFDIVQLESVHLGEYLPLIAAAPNRPRLVVCDWHNIESEILRRYSQSAESLARRIYARSAGRNLERYERRFIEKCNLHLAVSDRDAETLRQFGANGRVAVIENGVDAWQFTENEQGERQKRHRILFVGAMDYHANVDAAVFFAREVWPQVARRLEDAVFTIVGRNPTAEVRALASGERIQVTGTVPDVRPYYREAAMAVAPLRVGGGTRLKILEAMAAGVPVIATTVGAEGLAAEPGRDYVLADKPDEIAQAILSVAGNADRLARIAAAGRELARRRYDWAVLGEALAERLTEAVKQSNP